MLSYPSTITLSTRTLKRIWPNLLRGHRMRLRSRWRRLNAGEQALLC